MLSAAAKSSLTLLIPKPTEDEITRHISEGAEKAIKELQRARRDAPFLAKWNGWPFKNDDNKSALQKKLIYSVSREYEEFKQHFTVIPLGYDLVDLPQVMMWYNQIRAPFAEGEKRKEFPDAIALSTLLEYARRSDVRVAVVSADKDFKRACEHHAQLSYFPALDALTQALIQDQKRVDQLIDSLKKEQGLLCEAIESRFPELYFYPVEDPSGNVEDVEPQQTMIDTINILEAKETEATIGFRATVSYSAHISFDDPDSYYRDDDDGELHSLWKRAGTVKDSKSITGTATVELGPEGNAVDDIVELEIDRTEIGVNGYPRRNDMDLSDDD